jgi:hypothetical protein
VPLKLAGFCALGSASEMPGTQSDDIDPIDRLAEQSG